MRKLELIVKERRLEVAGSRIENRGHQNTSSGYTEGTERLREKAGTPKDIIRRDLKDTDISWDEAEELVTDRAEWR